MTLDKAKAEIRGWGVDPTGVTLLDVPIELFSKEDLILALCHSARFAEMPKAWSFGCGPNNYYYCSEGEK